ncbi:MAG: DegQ family serine endoprotease [Betaproteobacteria bacterium]
MNSAKPISVWIAVALVAAVASGCDPKTPKTPKTQAPAAAIADARAASALQPHNLPDFSALVQEVGPAIVNIRAITESEGAVQAGNIPKDDPLYDFFRRFGAPDTRREPTQGMGSGLIVTADGLILTNAHVVQDASDVTVKLTDRREFKARVVGADRRSDIAVLKIDATALPTVKIGDPEKIRVGEWVAAIGSPFGLENSVTSGIVSAKSRSLPDSNYVPFIQTDVAVNPGSSGGPLLNMQGEVIGINSQIYSRTGGYMGLSFAIPIDVASRVQKDLIERGKVSRGKLGIGIQSVDQALAKSFRLDEPAGVIVNGVEPGGPAERAGVRPGDIILTFDGKEVGRPNDLPTMVAETRPGTKTQVGVWRKGDRKLLTVTVGELPDDTIALANRRATAAGGAHRSEAAGLAVRPLTPEERQATRSDGGLIVENVQGPAARAGIQPGDVIVRVNEKPVANTEELREAIATAGETVALLVQRDSKRVYVAVTPG